MPSGRDSFRRNRVAPYCYDSLQPYYITRPQMDVAAEAFSRHIPQQADVHRTVYRDPLYVQFLANSTSNHQRFAGNPGRFSGSQKNRGR